MGLYIWFNERTIYNGRKGPFGLVYENLFEIYENKLILHELNPSSEVAKCIEALVLCRGGVGVDIANYIHSKEEMLQLVDFISFAVKQYSSEFPNEPEEYKDELWRFHKNLLEIAEELD